MSAKPGQSDRQDQSRDVSCAAEQKAQRTPQRDSTNDRCRAVDDHGGAPAPVQRDGENGDNKQTRDAPHLQSDSGDCDDRNHVRSRSPPDSLLSDWLSGTAEAVCFSLTPRPCEWLAAPSSISSIPTASKAAISLTSESTLQRTIVSLASIR